MLIRFCGVSSRAFGRSITSRSGSVIAWIEGTNGLVERISTAGPSFSCTIRKLLISAILLTTEEAADFEAGCVVWERSHRSEYEHSHPKRHAQLRPQTAARQRLPERKGRRGVFHGSARVLQQPYHSGAPRKKTRGKRS